MKKWYRIAAVVVVMVAVIAMVIISGVRRSIYKEHDHHGNGCVIYSVWKPWQ